MNKQVDLMIWGEKKFSQNWDSQLLRLGVQGRQLTSEIKRGLPAEVGGREKKPLKLVLPTVGFKCARIMY